MKSDDADSNLLALKTVGFLASDDISSLCHVYGLDDDDVTAEVGDSELADIASKYEDILTYVLSLTGGRLDCAVLGVGEVS